MQSVGIVQSGTDQCDCSMQAEGSQVGAAYAKALIEVAQDSNSLEDTHKDVDALMALLKENPQLACESHIQAGGLHDWGCCTIRLHNHMLWGGQLLRDNRQHASACAMLLLYG